MEIICLSVEVINLRLEAIPLYMALIFILV